MAFNTPLKKYIKESYYQQQQHQGIQCREKNTRKEREKYERNEGREGSKE